jgi:LmbE family N-acetylglucosaminyl deacetylase
MITKRGLTKDLPYNLVVVISPHPDDSCIAAGGLLYRLAKELPERETHVFVMTSGHRGVTDRYLGEAASDDGSPMPWSAEERSRIREMLSAKQDHRLTHEERDELDDYRAAIRRQEVKEEAEVLGFVPHYLDLEIYEEHTVTEGDEAKLSAMLSELRSVAGPRLLIMPGRYEQHQTHRLAADLVRKVVDSGHRGAYELWAYDSPWSAMMPKPDIIVPFSQDALQAKLEATRCHRSQIQRTPYAGIVEGASVKTAAVLSEWFGSFDVSRALDLGHYAEAFERLVDSIVYE